MKRRFFLIILVAAAIVVVAFIAWRFAIRRHQRSADATEAANPSIPVAITSAVPTLTLDERKQRQQEDRAQSIDQSIEKTNVPISFWGRVVDQDEQPIVDVTVRYSYSTEHGNLSGARWGEQKIYKNEMTTDANGVFAIGGIKGHTLTIESLAKEGYKYTPKKATTYNYYGDTASGKFSPHPANAVVFVMTTNAAAEPLVAYGGSFGKSMQLPGDGTPLRWSVWKGQPDPTGELQITFKRDPAVLARVGEPITWFAKVAIIGGGIVEAQPDEPFYRAPVDGYIAELDYPKLEQKRGVSARKFYIKTDDGKYGRVELDLYADDEGSTARCLIKAVMNPSGSRNLEYDEHKIIK